MTCDWWREMVSTLIKFSWHTKQKTNPVGWVKQSATHHHAITTDGLHPFSFCIENVQ